MLVARTYCLSQQLQAAVVDHMRLVDGHRDRHRHVMHDLCDLRPRQQLADDGRGGILMFLA